MIYLIEVVTDTLSSILNLNYAVVSLIATFSSNFVLSILAVFQSVYTLLLCLYTLATCTLNDLLQLLVLWGKVSLWFAIQLVLYVKVSFSYLDACIYSVYEYALRLASSLSEIITLVFDLLLSLVRLPYAGLELVDSNFSWCYRELLHQLRSVCSIAVNGVSECIYLLMLTPHSVANLIFRLITHLFYFLQKLCIHSLNICADSYQFVHDILRDALSKMCKTFASVFNTYGAAAYHCIWQVSLLSLQTAKLIRDISEKIYFHNVTLMFDDSVTIPELLLSLLLSPLQIVIVIVRNVFSYLSHGYHLVSHHHTVHTPRVTLPDFDYSLYCVVEELVWVSLLTIKTNWVLILIALALGLAVYLAMRIRARHLDNVDRERAVGLVAGNQELPAVIDLSESESDGDSDPILIQLPPTRPLHPIRSRSSTPDLSMPGSETRYIRKLKVKLDNELNDRLCTVCQERNRDILLLPCKHVCICNDCTQQILRRRSAKCPLCRTKISQAMNVFL